MLDINLFRPEKGGDPDLIRESQRRRYAPLEVVDEVIELDKTWRECQYQLDQKRKDFNKNNKEVAKKKIAKEDASELIAQGKAIDDEIKKLELQVEERRAAVDQRLTTIGNLVHDSVPIDNDEANNFVTRTWGEPAASAKYNHVDLIEYLDIADVDRGTATAGGRGYYLKGLGVLLNQALISFGLSFLVKRGYTPLQTPFFMRKETMAACAQLAQFDEELYKVSGEGDDKYLIATSEQPLCAFHKGEWLDPKSLPLRYAGYSTCFRKEAGSHGRDTLGIFRVHQFEKVEQFCIVSPGGTESWDMHEELLKNSEDFYQEIGLPYRVVSIVSGALNDAAAKKYDLEAWFPASQTFRELVSCSNCTDYQARNLEIRYGNKKMNDQAKQYVHLLNSTLTATERTVCCILENFQTEEGVRVPSVLQPFMMGIELIPFVNLPTATREAKPKKGKPAVVPSGSVVGAEGVPTSLPNGAAGSSNSPAAIPASAVSASSMPGEAASKGLRVEAMPFTPSATSLQRVAQDKATLANHVEAPGAEGPTTSAASLTGIEVLVDHKTAASRSVRLFCLEAGLAHILMEAGHMSHLNVAVPHLGPPGSLPLLKEGNLVLGQSHAIMRYLAEKLHSPLYPNDTASSSAKVEQVLEWNSAFWHGAVQSLLQGHTSAGVKQGLEQLEAWLAQSSGKYLTGRGLTIADISVACTLAELEDTGYGLNQVATVRAWYESLKARRCWGESL
eukprot:SM000031S11609  [mRNA]  locus=s31:660382:664976:- [translate_table: standard]